MTTISIEEMQRDLSGYLQRVSAGETMLVMQGDKAIAEIKPIAAVERKLRPFGLCAGDFTVPADFDAPLPDSVLAEFEADSKVPWWEERWGAFKDDPMYDEAMRLGAEYRKSHPVPPDNDGSS